MENTERMIEQFEVKGYNTGNVHLVQLVRETLSDGSYVWNIYISEDIKIDDCENEETARDKFNALWSVFAN